MQLVWQSAALSGRSLIEASAGTGKTHQLTLLYVRQILEARRSVLGIFLATFTEAAAAELRLRIRQRLLECLHWVQNIDADVADDQRELAEYLWQRGRGGLQDDDRLALINALNQLDAAPIGTIHALSMRLLKEFPFECAADFSPRQLVDQDELGLEIVRDLWRREVQFAEVDSSLLQRSPEYLAQRLKKIDRPGAIPRSGAMAQIEMLLGDSELIAGLRELSEDKSYFGSRKSKLRTRLGAIAGALEARDLSQLKGGDGKAFDESEYAEQFLNATERARFEQHPAAARILPFAALLFRSNELIQGALLNDWLEKSRQAMNERALQRSQWTFDQIIEQLHHALRGESGADLAGAIRARYPVAMVDEFQDTDTRQFDIFDRIWPAANDELGLTLIGDPKQAIYGFRGGDIFAYLAAAKSADQRYTLRRNYRSVAKLVAANNALYKQTRNAFLSDEIRYQEIESACTQLVIEPSRTGLHVHRFELSANKPEKEFRALSLCADAIADLLGAQSAQAVLASDVAVLLRTNKQIDGIKPLLRERGIRYSTRSGQSVYSSKWAEELRRILQAIDSAHDESLVRAAFATRCVGGELAQLQCAARGEAVAGLDIWRQHCRVWHQQLAQQGICAVIEQVLLHCAPNLLPFEYGERAMTDLRHLAELLQSKAAQGLGFDQLVLHLARQWQMTSAEVDDEESSDLRMESDQPGVRLLTIHAAKGLQFPFVFIPFLPEANSAAGRGFQFPLYHDDAGQLCIDLGSSELADSQAREAHEKRQENTRLAYVAITRAKLASHVFINVGDYVRSDGAGRDLAQVLAELCVGELPAEQDLAQLTVIDSDAADRQRESISSAEIVRPISVRELPYTPLGVGRCSFSSVMGHAHRFEFAPAGDELDAEPLLIDDRDEVHLELQTLSNIKGTVFGNAVHYIFEHERGCQSPAELTALIRNALLLFGIAEGSDSAEVIDAIAHMLRRNLQCALPCGVSLEKLALSDRVAEMRFEFKLSRRNLAGLRALCKQYGWDDLIPEHVNQSDLAGYFNGAIDLVFRHAGRYYILDYKSNWLGSRAQDYRPENLAREMHKHAYGFQAFLYCLALDRFLQRRITGYCVEQQLGGAYYLFVRGFGLADGLGLSELQFPPELIKAARIWLSEAEHAL